MAGLVFSRSYNDFPSHDLLATPEWEQSFLKEANRSASSDQLIDEKPPAEPDSTARTAGGPAWHFGAKKFAQLTWECKVADDRKAAMEKWRLLIGPNPAGSLVGQQLAAASSADNSGQKSERILIDTFESKATKTLEQRAGSLLLYSRWLILKCDFSPVFPFVEDSAYSYLSDLKTERAPASRGQKFREAVAFSHGVVGALGAMEVISSRRCQGAAIGLLKNKAKHQQRDPYTVDQLRALEAGVFSLESEVDRILSGNAAALTHWRARFSDVFLCSGEPVLDEFEDKPGYFEIGVQETKVTKKDKKRKTLPLAGHSRGVSGLPWAREWIRLRVKHGCDATNGPLITSLTRGGSFTRARMGSNEFKLVILDILMKMGCPCLAFQLIGTHSCKTTLLSWGAKAGMVLSERETLGYHSSGAAQSALLYSRDALAGPLRSLGRVLDHIRELRFFPDQTRSGRWAGLMQKQKQAANEMIPVDGNIDLREADGDGAISSPDRLTDIESIDSLGFVEVEVPLFIEESEDDGFGRVPGLDEGGVTEETSVASSSPTKTCLGCGCMHFSFGSVYECGKCELPGCSECLPVFVIKAVLVCLQCLDPNLPFPPIADTATSEIESSDSASSPSSELETSGGEEELEDAAGEFVANQLVGRKAAKNASDITVQHRCLKTLHLIRSTAGEDSFLACGRKLSDAYELLSVEPCFQWARCRVCYGSDSKHD